MKIPIYLLLLLITTACCSIPNDMEKVSFKVAAPLEVSIPQKERDFFVPLYLTNDSIRELCFEKIGKRNGLVVALEVEVPGGGPVILSGVDQSGLSGKKLRRGRTLLGLNSPQHNEPLGFYLSASDKPISSEQSLVSWKIKVTHPTEPEGKQVVLTQGRLLAKFRRDNGEYLMLSEHIPFASKLDQEK